MQQTLDAIASPRRREILRLVWSRELSAGEIAAHFDVSWPAVSQNLNVLREAGLVSERRDGRRRLYRAEPRALGPLAAALREMWKADLKSLKREVERGRRER
ncbi:MAG: metalloregulator ArsR/SmtB family transcription factor [Actinobacteria bacterium]|nr:metalloregulator ArsR/SmtB family transcription factor [Actinomycetota bacterium]